MSQRLFRSTFIVGSMTLLSRILGLAREMVFATQFGANAGMDAFLVAFKIPNFMRRLFAEGAFAQAFVPIFAECKNQQDEATLKQSIRYVAGTLALIVFALAVIGMLTSAVWIAVFAPGFIHTPHKFHLAETMLRITFPYIFFISLTALSGSILNCFSRFAVPALTPVLLNVCIIAAVFLLAPHLPYPIVGAAIGVCLGGVVQLLFQLPFLYRMGMLIWPKWGWHQPVVRKVITLMVPALFGASVAQISLLLDTIFASFLPTGSVSWLYYSDRLMQFPLGVFGVALSTVALPSLAQHVAQQSETRYRQALSWALRLVLLLGVPAAVGLGVLSGPLIATLFGYHQFNMTDVMMSQRSLIAFSSGLLFFIAVKVLVSAFYARQNMKTPVRIAVICMLSNLILNALLIWPLAHAGLALATSLSALLNVSLLLHGLHRRNIFRFDTTWWRPLLATVISALLMAGLLFWLSPTVSIWLQWHGLSRLWHLLLDIVVAAGVYFLGLTLCGIRKRHFVQH